MPKNKQLPLPLTYPSQYQQSDFLNASCYQDVMMWLNLYPNWYHHALLILGPASCGKTHLVKMFTKNIYRAKDLTFEDIMYMPELCAVEDIDETGVDETILFHLYNFTAEKNRKVLLSARAMPLWKLPDLKSRMAIVPTAKIGLPDDKTIMLLILKEINERQLEIESDVIDYVLKHIDRSFENTLKFVHAVQMLSLAQKRKITIPLAKQAIELINAEKLL
jgi:chromosomal replication initiation ATPase DnaA